MTKTYDDWKSTEPDNSDWIPGDPPGYEGPSTGQLAVFAHSLARELKIIIDARTLNIGLLGPQVTQDAIETWVTDSVLEMAHYDAQQAEEDDQ